MPVPSSQDPPPEGQPPGQPPPTGLPEGEEDEPLGGAEPDPDGEGEPARGPEAMPGIPTDGEPPAAS